MQDQTRNLNPTPEAYIAMCIWGKEYREQKGGSMDFWDSLSPARQRQCEAIATSVTTQSIKQSLLELKKGLPKRLPLTEASDEYARHAYMGRNGVITEVEQLIDSRLGEV